MCTLALVIPAFCTTVVHPLSSTRSPNMLRKVISIWSDSNMITKGSCPHWLVKFHWNCLLIACVCVCVFIFFHRRGFFRLQDVWDILEKYGSTILCCEYLAGCFCQIPSSPYLKMSCFTSKDQNSSLLNTREKTIWYIVS